MKRKLFWLWFIGLLIGIPIVGVALLGFLKLFVLLAIHHPGILAISVFVMGCYLLAELFSE